MKHFGLLDLLPLLDFDLVDLALLDLLDELDLLGLASAVPAGRTKEPTHVAIRSLAIHICRGGRHPARFA